MGKIRVVIVDDSSLARGLLRDFLEGEDDIEIVGEACNGREAVELARELKPDLMTMDLEMPVMNGLEAIKEIMCSKAVPILVVSSVANASNALAAIGHGALDVVQKPDYTPQEAAYFVAKVRMLARMSVITRLRPRTLSPLPDTSPLSAPLAVSSSHGVSRYPRVFAIACSTGGPQALAQILPALPADFSCPVVIAQHISDGFASGMVEWLGTLCRLPVRLAADGDFLKAGVIYLAPPEFHCSVTLAGRIALQEPEPLDVYHPSCDLLLSSIANVFGKQAVGIILTGMSSDGAKGIVRIREKGGATLAQDEASSVIYGMNRVAIECGGVQQVLPLEGIVKSMMRLAVPECVA